MKKAVSLLLALMLTLALLCGCSSGSLATNDAYNEEVYINGAEKDYVEMPNYDAEDTVTTVASNRKLIRTLSLTVETENYDELLQQLQTRVALIGGYVENMEANTRYPTSGRNAYLTIRVPADRLDEFSDEVGSISNVVYRSESNRDITTAYVDTESRRDALTTEQTRLLELMEQAQSLDEILQIESRLTEVRYELQSMEAQLRTYDNQVDYATIDLNITEVKVYTETEEKGFWEKLGSGFVDSAQGAWNVLKAIFSGLIVYLPYVLLVSIVPLTVLFFVLRSLKKRRARRNSDKNSQ